MPKVRREGRIVYIRKKEVSGETSNNEKTVEGRLLTTILGNKIVEKDFKEWTQEEISKTIKGVNPDYKTNKKEYRVNCQRCAMATEMAMRGYDVTAMPNYMTDDYDKFIHHMNQFKNQYWISGGELGKTKASKLNSIIKIVKSWGDGARGLVAVTWKTGNAGHILNIVNKGGEVYFVDGQDGSIEGAKSTKWWQYTKPSHTTISRVDNLIPYESQLNITTKKK